MMSRANAFCVRALCAVSMSLGAAAADAGPAETRPTLRHDSQYVIAAYGCFIWWQGSGNSFSKPWANDFDLRRDFPERQPLAGWYDDTQERFDRHLQAMADCGLDVLIIDWYPIHVTEKAEDRLRNGLRFFMASQLDVPVKFCLSLINHEPFAMKTDAQWDAAIHEWIKAFRHPRYWKVDGKPVFTIHSNWHLEQHAGGPDGAARRIKTLRQRVREAGFPGILIGGGAPRPGQRAWFDPLLKKEGYDFMTFYNLVNWEPHKDRLGKDKDTALSYRELMTAHFDVWQQFPKQTDVPFVPYLTDQWDPRPWWGTSPAHCLRYEEPTETEYREFFAHARRLLDASPRYRLPTADGTGVKALFICAWNELAEGSIICPTAGAGNRDMRIINDVFSR